MPARPDTLLPDDIERLVQLGGDLFHDVFRQVMAVLFGDISAEDAWGMAKAAKNEQMLH